MMKFKKETPKRKKLKNKKKKNQLSDKKAKAQEVVLIKTLTQVQKKTKKMIKTYYKIEIGIKSLKKAKTIYT